MQLKFNGVRGSRPVHKDNLLHYGGNSTSLQFLTPGKDFMLFIDGGSGFAHTGIGLGKDHPIRHYHVLITHTHWDHILGIPFFAPMYNPANTIHFYSSKTTRADFQSLFIGLHRDQHLPIPSSGIKASIRFHTLEPGVPFQIDPEVRVTTYQLNHQGITLGYRVESGEHSGALITDNAPIEGGNHMGEGMAERAAADPAAFETEFNRGLVRFLKDCHTVAFDTHFTEQNLKADWGHSTPQRALEFCASADVKRLILFHHAPEDADKDVQAKLESVRDRAAELGIELAAAREGDVWDLA